MKGTVVPHPSLLAHVRLLKATYRDDRFWRSIAARGQKVGTAGNKDSNQRASRAEVLDLDRREYLGRPQHVQEDVGFCRGIPRR